PGAVKAAVQCAEGAALTAGRNARPCIQRGMASATQSPGRTFLLCRIGHSHFATTPTLIDQAVTHIGPSSALCARGALPSAPLSRPVTLSCTWAFAVSINTGAP